MTEPAQLRVPAQNERTSGEAEWALVITDEGVLLTTACDHTDHDLEAHDVAWSKNAAPDVPARKAWRLEHLAELLPPSYRLPAPSG